jgi:hypothetical protein
MARSFSSEGRRSAQALRREVDAVLEQHALDSRLDALVMDAKRPHPLMQDEIVGKSVEGRCGRLVHQKQILDRMGVGHLSEGFSLMVGEPFLITGMDFDRMVRYGGLYAQMLKTANRLYANSLDGGSIVTRLAEGGLSREAVMCQRALYTELYEDRLPLLFRADMLSLDKTVELNMPGGGLAIMESIAKVTAPDGGFGMGLAMDWAEALRELSGKKHPRVALPLYKDCRGEQEYFAGLLNSLGVPAVLHSTELPDPGDIDVLVRFVLEGQVKHKGWGKVWDAYTSGDVKIEPPPTSLYDSKVAELLAFHPATRRFFPDEVRGMFPETWLVERGGVVTVASGSGVKKVKMEDIASLPPKQRVFALKYAGAGPELSGGGRGVYQMDTKKGGKFDPDGLMHRAMSDWGGRHDPWLLQRRLRVDFPVTYLDEQERLASAEMRARIMPYYWMRENGDVQIIGGAAVFRNNWKVHAQKDAVISAIRVV